MTPSNVFVKMVTLGHSVRYHHVTVFHVNIKKPVIIFNFSNDKITAYLFFQNISDLFQDSVSLLIIVMNVAVFSAILVKSVK